VALTVLEVVLQEVEVRAVVPAVEVPAVEEGKKSFKYSVPYFQYI